MIWAVRNFLKNLLVSTDAVLKGMMKNKALCTCLLIMVI